MKLQPDRAGAHTITAHGAGWIAVDGQKYTRSLLLGAQGLLQAWDVAGFEALVPQHFADLAALDCELLLLGSGSQLHFVPPAWLAPLMHKRIGVETMTTAAACRTYNVLAGEGRRVVAALLVTPPASPPTQARYKID